MDKIQTFKTPSGDEMVILPKADYDELIGSHASEDSGLRTARKVLDRVRAGTEPVIPVEVYKLNKIEGLSRIRAWRVYRKMDIPTLARKIKKSPSYVTQLENGTRKGTLETMYKLATAVGTTIDCLKN
jgi:DNA-binding XRE family transcriptional regulator